MTDILARTRLVRQRFTVTGVVQGVGFRPFVHRVAAELGPVRFRPQRSRAQSSSKCRGLAHASTSFLRRLREEPPPLAVISTVHVVDIALHQLRQRLSHRGSQPSPVAALRSARHRGLRRLHRRTARPVRPALPACLRELHQLRPPVHHHRALPYDRAATTMAAFAMCARCAGEYADPADRRFHAQPIACPNCGPSLWFATHAERVNGSDAALAATSSCCLAGAVVAVKGIGGYHLACRVDDESAVAALRSRKARGAKPFAMIVPDLDVARRYAHIDDTEPRCSRVRHGRSCCCGAAGTPRSPTLSRPAARSSG